MSIQNLQRSVATSCDNKNIKFPFKGIRILSFHSTESTLRLNLTPKHTQKRVIDNLVNISIFRRHTYILKIPWQANLGDGYMASLLQRYMCYHFLPSSVCENSMCMICYCQCMEKSVKLLKLAARLDKTSMEKYKDQNINN